MANDVHLSAYFDRIGFAGSIAPNLATLEALHQLHPAAIPFENLNPLLGLPVLLDQKSLNAKLLTERRGGYCFEHNLMFMRVLRELEFSVRGLAARTLWNHPEGAENPINHMVLLVEIGGASYLADVGFGGPGPTAPLKLKTGTEQDSPLEKFRLTGGDPDYRLEMQAGADWKPLYSFDLTPYEDADYEALNQAAWNQAGLRGTLKAARAEKTLRRSLSNTRLSTYVPGQEPERTALASVEAIKAALVNDFGIALPPADLLDPALERILALDAPPVPPPSAQEPPDGEPRS